VVNQLLNKINDNITNPLIVLMFAVAALVFFWGIFQFVYHMDSDGEREKGRQNILYGIIGMVIMVSVYGIINIITNTLSL
jgi:hypothetical protein